jgi:uncharacterized damage-inducible protein DinB
MERCRTLSPAQRELTAPGTYGTITATLEHIIVGELRYLARLGITVSDPGTLREHGMVLEELGSLHEKVSDAVERLFTAAEFDPDAVVVDRVRRNPADPPLGIESWVLITQFVHHGSDHRAHIGTILGAHGLAAPNLDVWAYGTAIGAVKALPRG